MSENEVVKHLEDEIKTIKKNWLSVREGDHPLKRAVARQWIGALKRDIEGLKSGKYNYTLDDLTDAQIQENDHYDQAKRSFEGLTDADYNDLCCAEKIDLYANFNK